MQQQELDAVNERSKPAFAWREQVQQRVRGQGGLPHHHPVQEARLVAHAHGRRVVPGGVPEVGERGAEPRHAKGEMRLAVAQVAAERDRDAGRGLFHPAGAEDDPAMIVDGQ